MICLEDLIGFCDLTPDEVHAIAEHEHIADAVAAVLGASMLHSAHGPEHTRDMFIDDIRAAVRRHDGRGGDEPGPERVTREGRAGFGDITKASSEPDERLDGRGRCPERKETSWGEFRDRRAGLRPTEGSVL